ncbi:hypothetical protein BgAZ_201660 [Babesia gibsoni]|uniref:Uncharacterized protein n=1 Tax=Babesia gibsoni TaxID=33632 RepID=A0AAD8LSR9_BABGI|nr:hypothetical protein BgAZ_201660 [Babesia gibsoni]
MMKAEIKRKVKAALLCALLMQSHLMMKVAVADDTTERARLFKMMFDLPKEVNRRVGLEVSIVNMNKFSKLLWGTQQIEIDPDVVHILVLYTRNTSNQPSVESQTPEGLYQCLIPILEAKAAKLANRQLDAAPRLNEATEGGNAKVPNPKPPPETKQSDKNLPSSDKKPKSSLVSSLKQASRKVAMVNQFAKASGSERGHAEKSDRVKWQTPTVAESTPSRKKGDSQVSKTKGINEKTKNRPPVDTSQSNKQSTVVKGTSLKSENQSKETSVEPKSQSSDQMATNQSSEVPPNSSPAILASIPVGEDERLIGGPEPTVEKKETQNAGTADTASNEVKDIGIPPSGIRRNTGPNMSRRKLANNRGSSFDHENAGKGTARGNKDATVKAVGHRNENKPPVPTRQASTVKDAEDAKQKNADKTIGQQRRASNLKGTIRSGIVKITKKLAPTTATKAPPRTSASPADVNPFRGRAYSSARQHREHAVTDKDENKFMRDAWTRQPFRDRTVSDPSTMKAKMEKLSLLRRQRDGSSHNSSAEVIARAIEALESEYAKQDTKLQHGDSIGSVDSHVDVKGSMGSIVNESLSSLGISQEDDVATVQGYPDNSAAQDHDAVMETSTGEDEQQAVDATSVDDIEPTDSISCKDLTIDGTDPKEDMQPETTEPYGAASEPLYKSKVFNYRDGSSNDSGYSIYNPEDREALEQLIKNNDICKPFHEYARVRYTDWESKVKDVLRYVCDIKHFRDDEYLYDTDEGLVADIVDWHDPGPYGNYYPQELVLQASNHFKTVEFEDRNKITLKVAHRRYGGWFEPQLMVILKSKDELHKEIGWSVSDKSTVFDLDSTTDVTEEVEHYDCPIDQEEQFLDVTVTGTLRRFPIWYYIYKKTGMAIEDAFTPLTFYKVQRAFEFYLRPKYEEPSESFFEVEEVDKLASGLDIKIPISERKDIEMLSEGKGDDAVVVLYNAYVNLIAEADAVFCGDGILRVNHFVNKRKNMFGFIITFVCLNILISLLSLVAIFVMMTKSLTPSRNNRISYYMRLWDIITFKRWRVG